MKQNSSSSAWHVSILTGEVFGGRCDYCNTLLSAEAISQNLYHSHSSHIPAVSAWTRILSPEEYRGLELRLRVELFVGRDRPILEDPLHLPCNLSEMESQLIPECLTAEQTTCSPGQNHELPFPSFDKFRQRKTEDA